MRPLIPDKMAFAQLRKLTEVSRALTYTTSLEDVFRLAVDRAAELLEADHAVTMLADEEGLLRIRAAHGLEEESIERFREPLNETLIRRLQGLLGVSPEECFLGVPLVVRGQVIGLLAVTRPEGKPCGDAEEWLLSALADQTAVAIETARLDEEVRRALEERVRAVEGSNLAKEKALAALGHDLRSPLNTIETYAQFLEMEIAGPLNAKQKEALQRIRMSGRHLLAIAENMFEMARVTAGVLRIRTGAVRIADVVHEVMLMLRPDAEARRQTLSIEPAPDLIVRADPDRLRQALINLVANAVKYTPEGGHIRVTASVREDAAGRRGEIVISDTGPGIPPDQLETIFEPYTRLADSDTAGGAGLGLAISRELVRQMDGDIHVESTLGQGSTFTVVLQLAE